MADVEHPGFPCDHPDVDPVWTISDNAVGTRFYSADLDDGALRVTAYRTIGRQRAAGSAWTFRVRKVIETAGVRHDVGQVDIVFGTCSTLREIMATAFAFENTGDGRADIWARWHAATEFAS